MKVLNWWKALTADEQFGLGLLLIVMAIIALGFTSIVADFMLHILTLYH